MVFGALFASSRREGENAPADPANKTSSEERRDPLVGPEDERFKTKTRQFDNLLGLPSMTLDRILDEHFDEHERLLFTPATYPPSLVKVQRDKTGRYRKLLEGRFASATSSISLK